MPPPPPTYHEDPPTVPPSPREAWQRANLQRLAEENEWKNDLMLSWLPAQWRAQMPRMVQCWLRNYVASNLIYFGLGLLWSYYIYVACRLWCFGEAPVPGVWDILEQMKVASLAIPLYCLLPTLTEAAVEAGYTRAYARIDDVGLPAYAALFVLYMLGVEFGVYWMHRELHDVKWAYRLLHHTHHKYNKEHTLSPFAGLAFHAVDGILQACPYVLLLFLLPMHFLTHELLLFATAVWTTNIHDCVDLRVEPIMGAGYHTIHHTTYRHNYGHYFVLMDYLFGTLITPDDMAADEGAAGRGGKPAKGAKVH